MDLWLDEEWRDIEGWPEYQISSFGRVWSWRSEIIMRPALVGHGYLKIKLSTNGYVRYYLVHRLVAEAFIGPSYGQQVNHIDGDKTHNAMWNLEWVSAQQNIDHATVMGLNPDRGLKKIPVRVSETNEVFASLSACARHFGIQSGGISAVLSGRTRHHKGYHFEYMED